MEKIFQEIKDIVRSELDGDASGHDFYHALRVFKNAQKIQQQEGGDMLTIGVAAFMHDMLRPWEQKTKKSHFGEEALEIIEGKLQQTFLSQEEIEKVIEVIRYHDVYDWNVRQEKSLELQILQDADNLDAIGAIGVGRTFAFGGAHNLSMYQPGENLTFTKPFVEDAKNRTTTVAHFHEKLLKLADEMNTQTGKQLAQDRHQFMLDFLKQFMEEFPDNLEEVC